MDRTQDPQMALAVMRMIRSKSDAECEQIFKRAVDQIEKVREADKLRQEEIQKDGLKLTAQNNEQRNQIELKKVDSPENVAKINADSKENLLEKKQTFEEDKMTVQFQNDMANRVADIIKEKHLLEIGEEEEVPA